MDATDGHRPPGRPIEVPDGVRVQVRVTPQEYDQLDRIARARGASVPMVIRQAISELKNTASPQTR